MIASLPLSQCSNFVANIELSNVSFRRGNKFDDGNLFNSIILML